MKFADKHVVVTGGGSGVGAKTAQHFRQAGARVTIIGRTEASLEAQQLPYRVCDVTDNDAVQSAFASARESQGPISIAVANAGTAESAPFSRVTPDLVQSQLSVNVIGVINTWRAALDDMKNAGWGRMIAIASTAGLKGYAYVSPYCAAKHAVVGLTRSLALELARTGITVNAICPGFVDTPMLDHSIKNITEKTGLSTEQARESLLSGNPQARFIQSEEVAETALWLCSESARSINGHALSISGGEV